MENSSSSGRPVTTPAPAVAGAKPNTATGRKEGLSYARMDRTGFNGASLNVGFVLFYGLEYMVTVSAPAESEPDRAFSTVRIASFAGYSSLIAYLVVRGEWTSVWSRSLGRWILALAVMIGRSVGILTSIPEQWLARIRTIAG